MASTDTLVLPSAPAADFARGSIFFVGGATAILRYAGLTLLTDPDPLHARGERFGCGLDSSRRSRPTLELSELPPLDLVLLSHAHGDPCDAAVPERLPRGLPILTTPAAASALRRRGFGAAYGLEAWQTIEVAKGEARLRVTAMPGKHGSGILSAFLPAVMASRLEFYPVGENPVLRLYVAGDTLVHEHVSEIPRRHPELDLALLWLGGTRVFGVLLTTEGDREGVRVVNPRVAIPVQAEDYPAFKSSLAELVRAVRAGALARRVRYLARGETYSFQVPESRRARSPLEPALQP